MAVFAAVTLLGALGSTPTWAQACTHFANASDGDDGNDGSQTAPVRSMEFAFSTFPDGSVVCVAAGEYFYGSDSDGIALTAQDKSMTFQLESFAGASEVRFSEKYLLMDIGSGTITFRAGTSSDLVFGSGIVNVDTPEQPDLLNFFHTLNAQTGTLAFTGVIPVFEESVGNPAYSNLANSDKIAPADAAIRYGDGNVTGSVTFTETPRTVAMEGFSGTSPAFVLPPIVPGSVLSIAGSNTVSITQSLDFSGSTLSLGGVAIATFTGSLSFDGANPGLAIDASFAGAASFEGPVSFSSSGSGSFLDHPGSGTLEFNRLVLSSASQARSLVLNRGGGAVHLLDLESDADLSSGNGHFLDLQNLDGLVTLGTTGASLTYRGAWTNADAFSVNGDVFWGDAAGEAAGITNTGTLTLSGSLGMNEAGFLVLNEGSINGSGGLSVANDGSIAGSGTWEGFNVVSGTVTIDGNPSIGNLAVSSTLRVAQNSSPAVSERIDIGGSGRVELAAGSSLSADLVVLSGSASIVLPAQANLILTSEMNAVDSAMPFAEAAGSITLQGSNPVTVRAGANVTMPRIVSEGTTGDLRGGQTWNGFTASGAELSVNNAENVTIGPSDLNSGSSLTISATGIVTLNGDTALDASSRLTIDSATPLALEAALDSEGGSVSLPLAGLRVSGNASIRAPAEQPIVLPSLLLDSPIGFLEVAGSVEVTSSVAMESSGIYLSDDGRLAISGDLTRSGGNFALESTGNLIMNGSSPQMISGFTGSVLPNLISQGFSTVIDGNLAVIGYLRVASGDMSIASGSTINLQSDLAIVGGDLTMEDDASITVGTDLNMSAGSFSLGQSTLRIQENVVLAGGQVNAGESTWIFPGTGESVFLVDTPASLNRLQVDEGVTVTIEGQAPLSITEQLLINQDGSLTIGNADVNVYPGSTVPSVQNAGTIQTRSGSLNLLGLSGVAPSLGGAGWFGDTTINLGDDQLRVGLFGTGALKLSGLLTFVSGGLDLSGATVHFNSDPSVSPGLHFVLSDVQPANGEIDGQGFVNSAGAISFNPDSVPFDLQYSGDITTLYDPPQYLATSVIDDLTLHTQDPVNSPPIFGLAPSSPMTIRGRLSLTEGVVLRLQESFRLEGEIKRHDLSGRVSGASPLIIAGQLADFRLTGPSSSIESLSLQGTDTFASSTLRLEGTIGALSATSGRYTILGPVTLPTNPVRVLEGADLSGVDVTLGTTLQVGSASGANALSVDGSLTFQDNGNVSLPFGGHVSVSDRSSVTTDFAGAVSSSNGYLSIRESAELDIRTRLPKLWIDINGNGVDEVFLQSDLIIGESLELLNGDIQLGGYNLRLEGGIHRFDADEAASDGTTDGIIGDIAQQPGSLTLGADATLTLGGNLGIQAASVVVDPGASSSVQIQPIGTALPSISQSGGMLELRSGALDLGTLDWVINSSAAGILTTSGGHVIGTSLDTDPGVAWSRLDDDLSGELVLIGSGNATINSTSASSLRALRIEGTVRMAASSAPLSVTNRFVFGQNGASLLTNAAGDLVLEAGTQVIRRGLGSLSHRPASAGPIDLAYQLGNGNLTGLDTGFASGTLSAGLEVPNQTSIDNLLLVAGSAADGVHSVTFAGNLTVTSRLDLVSGRLSHTGKSFSMADGAQITIANPDREAPTSLSLTNALSAAGSYTLQVEQGTSRMDIPANLMATNGSLESLTILGPAGSASQESVRILGPFSADYVAIGGDGRAAQLNLTGNTLTAGTEFVFDSGTITSSQPARIEAMGMARILQNAAVTGNIQLATLEHLDLEGSFAGLSIDMAGDANLTGSLGSSTRLTLSGVSQDVTFRDQLAIATLQMMQTASPGSARWHSDTENASLRITSGLELEGGILDMANSLLIIGESARVTRASDQSIPSHVNGRIQRPASEGSTRELVFPVGNDTGYLPLTLTFSRPLLSATSLTVSLPGLPIVSAAGLPIVDQEAVMRSLADPIWQITSTVDFALAQQYSLAATLPDETDIGTSPIRMLRQGVGRGSTPWALLPGTQLTAVTQDGVIARTFDTRGGLSPRGVLLSIGTQETWTGGTASWQFVDARPTASSTERVLMLDDQRILTIPASGQATSTAPFFLRDADPVIGTLRLATSMTDRPTSEISLTSDSRNWAILSQGEAGTVQLDAAAVAASGAPEAGTTGYVVFNALESPIDLLTHPEEVSIASVSAREFEAGSVSTDLAYVSVDVPDSQRETFQIDLTSLGGATSLWMVTPEGGNSRLLLLTAAGQIISPLVTTGDESVIELPTAATWLGNYPNPFTDRTKIRFAVGASADVSMEVFDVLGRRVHLTRLGLMSAGEHEALMDASRLAGGSYFVRLSVRGQREHHVITGKILLRR